MSIDPSLLATLLGSAASLIGVVGVGYSYRRLEGSKAEVYEATLRDAGAAFDNLQVTEGSTDEQRLDTLEDQLGLLSDLMAQSRRMVDQVSAELDARAATARRLQEEVKEAEALAAINREQADAIRRLMDTELQANRESLEA